MTEKCHNTIFIQVVNFTHRKLILKRIPDENQYNESILQMYSKEWDALANINEALYEPVEMCWPQSKIASYSFNYALGVEVPNQYNGIVPIGFDLIELPPCSMMLFQANLMKHREVFDIHKKIDDYIPELYGFEWSDDIAPRIRLATVEYRGYIEARPVKLLVDQQNASKL
jgi:AraC family transcriptional regulator